MKKLVVASNRPNAGKTSLIAGISSNISLKTGYVKPFGDRLIYRDKILWDHDAELLAGLMKLPEAPENLSLGFDHSRLRYDDGKDKVIGNLKTLVKEVSENRDILFLEAPEDFSCAASVNLDTLSVCRAVGGQILLVVAGNDDRILDDIFSLKKLLQDNAIDCLGVIINRVRDISQFNRDYSGELKELSMPVLGILPEDDTLARPTVFMLKERLIANVLAGEKGLDSQVLDIFVGAMSGSAVTRLHEFRRKGKLIITSGDRSDMILAAVETESVGVVLTNNIMPPANIIARASEKNVPLLLVPNDTYQVAKMVDTYIPPLHAGDVEKLSRLGEMVRDHIDLTVFK